MKLLSLVPVLLAVETIALQPTHPGVLNLAEYSGNERDVTQSHLDSESLKAWNRSWDSTGVKSMDSVKSASDFLARVNIELATYKHFLAEAAWNYQTNRTEENREELAMTTDRFNDWYVIQKEKAKLYRNATCNEDLKRQLNIFALSAISKNKTMSRKKSELENRMATHYSDGADRLNTKQKINTTRLQNPLRVISKSRDPEHLKEVWLAWRQSTGPPIKELYSQYVDILNSGANENGFPDYSVYWKQSLFYDTSNLDKMLDTLWGEIRPLYLQLHTYVRRKLALAYGADVVGRDGTIAAHLLGDMWGQHWSNIYDIVCPYPEADDAHIFEARLKEYLTPKGLFRLAEDFCTSLGLPEMTRQFWRKSQIEKDRTGNDVCHASAFDFFRSGDFRVKMCTKTSLSGLKTVFHEMGHIEYFMAYSHQPTIYRAPPSAAFHESVGDTIQLSVLSDKRLRALGLVDPEKKQCDFCREKIPLLKNHHRTKRMINKLMQKALDKLAFLPFGLLVDRWRWRVFQGNITPDNYNREWWEFRLRYQGIKSPVPRSERDFDPGAKYHIPAHMPFVRLRYQGIKSPVPRSERDFDPGAKYHIPAHMLFVRKMLTSGASTPWQEQLNDLTGSSCLTSQALLEYFRPLRIWLQNENRLHKQTIGWNGATINWAEE
ncbi:angiotensin-converting enzyme [Plakobranchus ocellatus]|uniref:Angiotensin-converting enzyme n=1 Tax=Plakobranchus ocellatus TaxID=259542 RepID=A0AAV4CEQ3_9GAST|nr:angiotensin-converting enzyme [Plakobranchus ocellatus]